MRLRTIISFILPLSIAVSALAQEVTNSFFIFCKDKNVIPFFFESVKSMRQCETLIEGELTQATEVITTDSIYTIPAASIDSISFLTPQTIRKPNSHEFTDELLDYLSSCDSLTLRFSSQTPEDLLPKIGDNVTRSTSTELLPCGFLGKVKSIQREEAGIIVDCDSIGFGDAFVRFYQPGGFITDPAQSFGSSAAHNTRSEYIPPEWTYTKVKPERKPLQIPIQIFPLLSGSYELPADFSFGFDAAMNSFYTLEPEGQYMIVYEDGRIFPSITLKMKQRVILETNWSMNMGISCDLDELLSNYINMDIIDIPIPIPYTGGLIRFELRPDFEISGEVAFDVKRTDELLLDYYIHYSENPNFKNTLNLNSIKYKQMTDDTAMFNGSFDFFMGIYAGAYFGVKFTPKKIRLASLGIRGGYDLNWNWKVGVEDFSLAQSSTTLYDYWRTEYVVQPKFVIEPQVSILSDFDGWSCSYSYAFEWPYAPLDSKTIFPRFKDIRFSNDNTSGSNLNYTMDDELFFHVVPGIKVFDENNNLVFSDYTYPLYKTPDNQNFYTFPFKNTLVNRKLTAYPAFKLFNREILASPSLPLYLEAIPVTAGARPTYTTVELFGEVNFSDDAPIDGKLDWSDSEVGFMIGRSPDDLIDNGTRVISEIDDSYSFSSHIEDLQPEVTYYYCAFITTADETQYGKIESFVTERTEEVDLGLSVNWRSWNLGADVPSRRGNLYAWGEVEPQSYYDWSTYFDNPYDENNNWNGCSIDTDISNSVFDPSTLLGAGWRMPTREEMQELVELCEWTWTSEWSVNGYRVTGPSGNSIFLPVTGLADKGSVNSPDQYGAYWTSTPQADTDGKATAATLYFYGEHLKSLQWANRYNGRAIRPVKSKE